MNALQTDGVIIATAGDTFTVTLRNGHRLLAYPAGHLRRRHIWLTVGDPVKVALTPYDLARGRITRRLS